MTYKALITNADAAKHIVDSIVTDAVALGWTRVESSYVHGLVTYEVIKSPASLNYFGSDFHLALGYDTASKGTFVCNMFEEWNTSSKMATAYCPAQNSSTVTGSYTTGRPPVMTNSAIDLAIASRTMYQGTMGGTGAAAIVAGENYWYSVTGDRLVAACTVGNGSAGTTRGGLYAGAYERFLPSSADPVPVVLSMFRGTSTMQQVSASNSSTGAATREPLQSVGATGNFAAGYWYDDGTNGFTAEAWTPVGLGGAASIRKTDSANELYSGRPWVSRIPVMGRAPNGVRGLFIGLYVGGGVNPTAGSEFRWTFAGNTYTATRMRGNSPLASEYAWNQLYMEQL
jgi:hypothetical protein